MNPRWKHRPPQSNWGDFGVDDQLGRMNWVTAEKVLQGIAQVKTGQTFCLSLPLDVPGGNVLNPRRMPPERYAVIRDGKSQGQQGFCWAYASEDEDLTDVVNDDVALLSLQYSTQWDSFAHVGNLFDADGDGVAEAVFYNGFRAGQEIVAGTENEAAKGSFAQYKNPEAKALSVENMAWHGMQGRGVMIDLQAHLGRKRQAVGYDALMRIIEADKIEISRGDMVCFHTGFADALLAMNRQPQPDKLHEIGSGLDGWDSSLLNWIVDCELACLIADNFAVELIQPKLFSTDPRLKINSSGRLMQPRLPLHEHCLFKNGIHLGELWYLTPLAKYLRSQHRSSFLLTAPPLRLPGAVGSPVTPIATV